MSNKKNRKKKGPPRPKINEQIPNSMIRPLVGLGFNSIQQNARDYPLHGCWIMAGWEDAGITPVVVARAQAPDRIMFGVYMVDLYCLGLKDVYTHIDYSLNHFNRELPKMCIGKPLSCSPELAHEVIYGAIEYAAKLGFQPHPDFTRQLADRMLSPAETYPRVNQVSFGKDGKTLFISGPYDDEWKCRQVVNTLMRTCGEGNFDYLVNLNGLEEME